MKRLCLSMLLVVLTSFSVSAKGCYAVTKGGNIINVPMSCQEYISLLNKSPCGCGSLIKSCYDYFVTLTPVSENEAYAVYDKVRYRIASDEQQAIADRLTRLILSGKSKKGQIEALFAEIDKKVGGKISPERIKMMNEQAQKNKPKKISSKKMVEMKKE